MKDIHDITAELEGLREANEGQHMAIAALMHTVKSGDMWALLDGVKSFSQYCESIRYHPSTVYTWIAVWNTPVLRKNYVKLGALVSKRLVQAEKKLDSVAWSNLVSACLTMGSKAGCEAVKTALLAIKAITVVAEPKTVTLADVLRQQGVLIALQTQLKNQLAECETQLTELSKLAAELSK